MLREAQADEINIVILHARFESRYFREQYLQRLVSNNLALIRGAHVLLIATRDDAGLYALLALGEKDIALGDMRIVVAGDFPRAVGRVLGAVLYRLLTAGEVVLVESARRAAGPLGDGARQRHQRRPDGRGGPQVGPQAAGAQPERVRGPGPLAALGGGGVGAGGARAGAAAGAQPDPRAAGDRRDHRVVRTLIGVETFGTFSPVIVSLAFLTTGLHWGAAIFAVIVGVGAFVRALLQHVRLQLVARLAILIAVVAGIMAGLTVLGASFGIGALMNVSIFPMVIMSNVIENFTTSQAEFGTREAVRLTINTLGLAALCYLAIETTGLQSVLLAFPELLVGAIVVDVVLGQVARSAAARVRALLRSDAALRPMGSLIERLRRVRREALGLNRRNQEFLLRLNPPRLVALVDHKVQTKEVLARHGLPVPDTFGRYVRQRELRSLGARSRAARRSSSLKPARGAGGEGVVVIAGRRDDRLVKASGAPLRLGDLVAHAADIIAGAFSLSQARDEALLEYRLAPEPVLAAYSPGGVPDVRVVLFRGVPVMAMLRLPTHASDGRANLHVGGVGVGIDLRQRPCRARHLSRSQRRRASRHAAAAVGDSRAALGRDPAARRAQLRRHPARLLGIDIVIDVHLGPVILELNARPG